MTEPFPAPADAICTTNSHIRATADGRITIQAFYDRYDSGADATAVAVVRRLTASPPNLDASIKDLDAHADNVKAAKARLFCVRLSGQFTGVCNDKDFEGEHTGRLQLDIDGAGTPLAEPATMQALVDALYRIPHVERVVAGPSGMGSVKATLLHQDIRSIGHKTAHKRAVAAVVTALPPELRDLVEAWKERRKSGTREMEWARVTDSTVKSLNRIFFCSAPLEGIDTTPPDGRTITPLTPDDDVSEWDYPPRPDQRERRQSKTKGRAKSGNGKGSSTLRADYLKLPGHKRVSALRRAVKHLSDHPADDNVCIGLGLSMRACGVFQFQDWTDADMARCGHSMQHRLDRWNGFKSESDDDRTGFTIIKMAASSGFLLTPGLGFDPSIEISDDERAWIHDNYTRAVPNQKNRVSLAASLARIGVSVDDLVRWVQDKQELNEAGAERFRAELDAGLSAGISERVAYNTAARALTAAGVGDRPARPKKPTPSQQARDASEPITAEDIPGYIGIGDPYGPLDCTPMATAMRFVCDNAGELLVSFDPDGIATPLLDTGYGIWSADHSGIRARIADQVKVWVDAGTELAAEKGNEDIAKAVLKYGKYMESPKGWSEVLGSLGAAVRSLSAEGRLPEALTVCLDEQLNGNCKVIGTPKGVLMLLTGELLPQEQGRAHLVSRSIPDEYVPDAQHWLADAITEHMEDVLVDWIWRSSAHCLLGVPGRIVNLHEGPSGSGKTTFLNYIRASLGVWNAGIPGYGAGLSNTALVSEGRVNANAHSEHLKPFVYARFITGSDLEDRRMNNSLIKQASGGDPLSVRGLSSKAMSDRPAIGTMNIAINPGQTRNLDLSDEALVKRLRVTPWVRRDKPEDKSIVTAAERDPQLRQAVFARLVRCLMEMQGQPPEPPAEVVTFTAETVAKGVSGIALFAQRIVPGHGQLTIDEIWAEACHLSGSDYEDLKARAFGFFRQPFAEEIRRLANLPPPVKLVDGENRPRGWRGYQLLEAE